MVSINAYPHALSEVGKLEDLELVPAFLVTDNQSSSARYRQMSCAFCGVGDSGVAELRPARKSQSAETSEAADETALRVIDRVRTPTTGCVKYKLSQGLQPSVFPVHLTPSVLDGSGRRSVSYQQAIERLADLLLAHRPPYGRTLLYACGQVDYFSVFSFQEVFRLLGVRNLSGNAEHCLNAGAVHNEILTGQEGPFLTIGPNLTEPGRFYLFNGWNGMISHPPVFHQICRRDDFDAYLIEVAETESAKALASKLGPDRVLLIRSGGDPHLALAVAHEILLNHSHAVEQRFVDHFADRETFERFTAMARQEEFSPENVAARIAAEPSFEDRLVSGIRDIAAKLASEDVVPINIPSVGLSQTKGVVSHCLWGNVFALLGKYGLKADGTPAGGTLRLPGQINAQTEVQGLSRNVFMGRIPMTEEGAIDAARRMDLPDDAYFTALHDTPRAALDYSQPTPGERELIICFGTQFESNMIGRTRWIEKLKAAGTTLVVIDPIPDPFTLEHADLVIPSPPHAAAAKLYQNGEWRLTVSVPRKRAAAETRTDATIVYDAMAEISRRLRQDEDLLAQHKDLAPLVESGYLQQRFESTQSGGQLRRVEGEVFRPQLWQRVLDYMDDGPGRRGRLYCRPEHANGQAITWDELIEAGSIIYGGVGQTRFRLDYDDPDHVPFRDVYRRPRGFRFFVPTGQDLRLPDGIVLVTGRSTLSDDKLRIRFAVSTFNSGKATPAAGMPDENPLMVSLALAEQLGLRRGDRAKVTNCETGQSLVLPVVPTDRVKGKAVWVNFHKSKAEIEHGRYLNTLTSHTGRCPYSSQTNMKLTQVAIERVEEVRVSKPQAPQGRVLFAHVMDDAAFTTAVLAAVA